MFAWSGSEFDAWFRQFIPPFKVVPIAPMSAQIGTEHLVFADEHLALTVTFISTEETMRLIVKHRTDTLVNAFYENFSDVKDDTVEAINSARNPR